MSELCINALWDRVIVKPEIATAPRMIGNMEIPGTVIAEPDRGVIVSIGPGTEAEPTHAKKGDTVIFVKEAAEKMTIDGVDYLLMREEDLIAII